MLQNRRHVRRDKELAVAETNDYRRPFTDRDDRIRLIDGDDRKSKYSAKLLNGLFDRPFERQISLILIKTNEVSDDLSVGLGFENASACCKTLL